MIIFWATTPPLTSISLSVLYLLKSAILASPSPSLAGLSQAQLSQAFDVAWAQTLPQMPSAIGLTSSESGFQPPAQIGQALDNAQNGLSQARQGIVYYQEAFWRLIGLTAFLVLCIILINHNVKVICRGLGAILMTYGITEAAGILISRGLVHNQMSSLSEVPLSLQPWLAQLLDGLMNPLLSFAISCAVLGVFLFIVSFLYHHRQEKPATV